MRRWLPALAGLGALAGCTTANVGTALESAKTTTEVAKAEAPAEQDAGTSPHGTIDTLVARYAAYYKVPESLVHRVIRRESNYNPAARNRDYYGLMQIKPATARSMGYHGAPRGLLDAETNLKYAVRYLAGAYRVARGNPDRSVRFYSRGYYYDAKRSGMLVEAGLRPPPAETDVAAAGTPASRPAALAQAQAPQSAAVAAASVAAAGATALAAAEQPSMAFAGATPNSPPLPSARPEGPF